MSKETILPNKDQQQANLSRLKLFSYVTLANYVFSGAYSLISHQYNTFWFMLIAVVSVIAALIIGIKASVTIGQLVVVTALNANIFLFCQSAGLMGISYIFFFPVLIASVILVGFDKLNWQIIYVIVCTTIALALTMHFAGEMPTATTPIETIRSNRNANVWIVFALMIVFVLLLVRLKFKSDQKLLAAIERAEEASKAKTKFLSVMSHELRTPLNGIIGIGHLLQSTGTEQEKSEYLKLLNKSADHMLRMIGDILDYNKMDSNRLKLQTQVFSVSDLFDDLYKQFSPQFEQKDLYLKATKNPSATNQHVVGDDVRIAQVLYNLLGNALKFTRQGGAIFSVSTTQQNEQLTICFSVQDTGVGIDAEDQETIFDDFQQGKVSIRHKLGGTGLGLSISKQILQLMDSELQVESCVGKGSHFHFSLVLPMTNAEISSTATKNLTISHGQWRILLVEDNPVNAVVATNMLKNWNMVVDMAKNGKEAIDHAEQQEYDLILMDLEMPVMDGFAATAALRSKNNQLPIIALTAALMEQDTVQKLFDLGFNDVVSKPFKPDTLQMVLQKFLN
jgi:signal transduction histidine kinase/ActR/RegA family two-component response regulator